MLVSLDYTCTVILGHIWTRLSTLNCLSTLMWTFFIYLGFLFLFIYFYFYYYIFLSSILLALFMLLSWGSLLFDIPACVVLCCVCVCMLCVLSLCLWVTWTLNFPWRSIKLLSIYLQYLRDWVAMESLGELWTGEF